MKRPAMLGTGLIALLISFANHAQPPAVNIAILQDGREQRGEQLRHALQNEIVDLTRGEFDVRFPEAKQAQGNWDLARIRRIVDDALSDTDVDIVITAGPVVSNEIIARRPFFKPVIAAVVVDADLQGLPVREDGTSGVDNLSYLGSFKNAQRDIAAFREIVSFERLAILIDALVLDGIPEARTKAAAIAERVGVGFDFVPVTDSAAAALKALPTATDAVYVTPLMRFGSDEFDKLVGGLIERGLPSFSMIGREEVERGILAGAAPLDDSRKMIRRLALNVQRILLGQNAGEIRVGFTQGEQLSVNMETARRIGVSPSWRILTEAVMLNEELSDVGRVLSLKTAMEEALAANLDLAVQDRVVAAGAENVEQARSLRRPQANVSAEYLSIDEDHAYVFNPEQALVGIVGIRQLVYSDEVNADVDIQDQLQRGREERRAQVELDIARDAGVAYLNVLRAKTLEQIEKENLKLTRSNLELARVREQVGTANRAEVARWESEIAGARQAVIQARARRHQAEIDLNRVLNRPLEEPFATSEATLYDPGLVTSRPEIFSYTSNPRAYGVFRDFMVAEGLENSPELREITAQITAQERSLLAARRSFWSPDVNLEGSVNEVLDDSGTGAGVLDDTSWQVRLAASLNFLEGGGKRSVKRQAAEELSGLQLLREATVKRVSTRIRISLEEAGASFAAIDLSRQAADAARETLDLVKDAYSRGALSVLDLLDAQENAFRAEQAAANSVHDFLIDWMQVQRAVGAFDYFRTPAETDAWFERLDGFFQKVGVRPSTP